MKISITRDGWEDYITWSNKRTILKRINDPLSKQIIPPDEMADATTRRLTKSSGRFAKIAHGVASHVWFLLISTPYE